MSSLSNGEEERALAPRVALTSPTPHSSVQDVRGISVTHGSFVQAAGNVNQVNHHYHGLSGPQRRTIDMEEVLRLVPNLRKIHLDVLSKATPGTAIWIFKADYWILWLDGNLKVLWGTGIPGAGKSVMASVVINELEARATVSRGSICVAYVYFRYSDAKDLTIRGVLEILVKQTVERHPDCAALAEKTYAQHLKEKTQPTQEELLQLLHRFTEVKSATFYVLDALDEAPEKLRVEIIEVLTSLNAKLFVTSRPLKAVEAKFPGTHSFTIAAQDGDLDLHISKRISRCEDLQDLLDADSSFKQQVVSSIKNSCGGMFLHASLQLDAISRCTSEQDVLDTLADFPSDIEDVYQQTWTRILSQTPKNVLLAKAVLVWVANAARSMTIEELRHAAATHPETRKFECRRLASASTLLSLCCGLVVVEEETKLVRLIHYTAKETLEKLLHETFPHPQPLLTDVCITHLAECGFQDTKIDSKEEYKAALQADPLLAYASESWATHARQSVDHPEASLKVANFVADCRAFPSIMDFGSTLEFDILTAPHIRALYSLPFDLTELSQLGEVNIASRKMQKTPLMIASWCGNRAMVSALVGIEGTQTNLTDVEMWSALMYAARGGHVEAARQLLTRPEIQINMVDKDGCSALKRAARHGHQGIVEALLVRPEIQINLVRNDGWSTLMMAARYGHQGIIEALLVRPEIQINMADKDGWSALMKAAREGHQGIVEALLVQPEIQINMVDKDGWSALMKAARYGHQGIVEALLARPEIQINMVEEDGWSALMLAACNGHQDAVGALLARPEILIDLVNAEGESALTLATDEGHEGIAKALHAHAAAHRDVIIPANESSPPITTAGVIDPSEVTTVVEGVNSEHDPDSSALAPDESSNSSPINSNHISTAPSISDISCDSLEHIPASLGSWISVQPIWHASRCMANSVGLSGPSRVLGWRTPISRSSTPISAPVRPTIDSDVD